MRFITIGTILILGFYSSMDGKEKNEEFLPNLFLGLERFDTSNAYIYSQEGKNFIDAKNIINNVVDDFKSITGEKPKKGILIVIDPLQKHPVSLLLDLAESTKNKELLAIRSRLSKITDQGLSTEEGLWMSPTPIQFKFFKVLVSIDQQKQNRKWSAMDMENFLKKEDTSKAVLDPWVLCLPSNKCLLHVSKKILPKIIRSEVGFFKYLLAKPFMGKVRAMFIEEFYRESKIVLFNHFLGTQELAKKEKNIFLKEYTRQLKMEESETSHKL